MAVSATVREVFGHFQNLNLLALLLDLKKGHTARQAWRSGFQLCPVAHGLATGRQVRVLHSLGQMEQLAASCREAAQQLGTNPRAIYRFIRDWDDATFGQTWLFQQLSELWAERLEDAEAFQRVLAEQPTPQPADGEVPENEPAALALVALR